MNSKIKDFLISQSIVFIFILVLVLFLNYVLLTYFGLNKDNFIFIITPLLALALVMYLFLIKPIFEPILKSDENLKKTVKETLHELNVPVSTILLNTQMLQRKIQDEKALKRLERISKASNELLKLYEEMEYSIKKEIDSVDKSLVDVKQLVLESLEKFEDIKKDIKIELDLDDLSIKVDKNGFKKALDNLLSNAIKYNNKENPFIKIELKNHKLCIYNNGKAIDTKNLMIVFEKYYQADFSKSGFGLGLNIVKEFCDKNKILITIETFEEGNSFNLDLSKTLS